MKRMLSPTAVIFSMLLLASYSNPASAQPRAGVNISYQTFYDELDPYGRWIDYPEHGYVWIPDAGPDFRPYGTNGHWVWSDDYEWMWVSDYDWGWAPFHYGRWLHDPYYGWVWVPGYEWSPAWVAWRDGGDYYGWAPLRPGINISINFSLGGYNPPIDYWCFAPRRYITSHRIYDYYVPRRNNITIINHTTIINNYNYNRNVFRTGPRRGDAERYTGRINPVRFRESSNPGRTRFRNNEVSIYRPRVQRDDGRNISPRRFEPYNRSDRNNGNIARRNGNNLPERRIDNNNRIERNNDRQRGIENRNSDRRRNILDRNNTGNVPDNPAARNRRIERPDNNNNRQARPLERRNIERPPVQSNPGRMERQRPLERNNEARESRPSERRSMERQQAPNTQRRMERRDVSGNNNQGGGNRREIRTPSRQTQPRQFERPNNNGGDNGRNRGRRDR